tara:strand:- start:386 stop:1333 length:948 start_codon:yes stop_codon:yes gene_type:complete
MDYKIMKRPMFKMGGATSAGTGITSGLDTPRQNFAYSTYDQAVQAIPAAFQKARSGLEKQQSALGPLAVYQALSQGALSGVQDFGDLAMAFGDPAVLKSVGSGMVSKNKLNTQIDALDLKEATTMATLLKKKDKSGAMRDNIALSNELNNKKRKLIADGLSPTSPEILFLEQQIAKVLSGDTPSEELLTIMGMTDDPADKGLIRRIYEMLGKEPPASIAKQAEGGRINKQMGGGFDMAQAPQTTAPGPEMMQPQGQDPFTILRQRLPKEIPDDVVSLIAYNKKAFADFANIQDQDDVDLFNQKYNVQLVVDLASR